MATLVLTVVGTALGGPIGGALGSIAGQAIDAQIFAPRGRKGPRLSDLKVQTSSYGTAIPSLYGTMRVAGTVIWSTDLIESTKKQSNGKGRGSTTVYSYRVSFAVALSSRRILNVGRIWAEGNLLRGNAGDFKTATGFRFHNGDEDQLPDPLIAAAEGPANCPAYRGIAYAVFEDFELADYGNRIPSLSFELFVDAGGQTIAVPLTDLLGTARATGAPVPIAGYAVAGATRAEAIAPLLKLVPVDRAPGADGWTIGDDVSAAPQPLREAADDRAPARATTIFPASASVPTHVVVSHYDPARDHQIGAQRARIAGGEAAGGRIEQVDLPAAMAATDAKALAGRLAGEAASRARRRTWPAGFAALACPPGTRVMRPGTGSIDRVQERQIEGAVVRLTLAEERLPAPPLAGPMAADPGRVALPVDRAVGETVAHLFDLPSFDGAGTRSHLVVAAAGSGEGWRGAALSVRPATGAAASAAGAVRPVSVLGQIIAVDPVAPGPRLTTLFDRNGSLIVRLLRPDMVLANASDADVLAGANLAAAGQEVIQFGHAEPLGEGIWRLTDLLRGRAGTEDVVAVTGIGDGFTLIDDPALASIESTAFAPVQPGGAIELIGVADADVVSLPITGVGRAQRPLSPVHGSAAWSADGGMTLSWIRRSRAGFAWIDGRDAPLDEREERYRIRWSAGPVTGAADVTASVHGLSPAQVAACAAAADSLTVQVEQLGEAGESPALIFTTALR